MTGCLVLVVGASGVGKDTLLRAAADSLAGDARFHFVRRVITRPPQPGDEDHEPVSEAEFARRSAAGGFALSWQAHGLSYGIAATIAGEVAHGRVVVANVSRGVVAEAASRFAVRVVEIAAPAALRAERLARRGRETIADIAERLARAAPLPSQVARRIILNDGSIEAGTQALRNCLLDQAPSLAVPANTAAGLRSEA